MEKTEPHPYLNKTFIGYVLNTPFTQESQETIGVLQQKFANEFGSAIYLPAPETLHITLMDWLAPLVDYGRDKDEIFKEIYEKYDRALEESIQDIKPICVEFNKIGVSREAIFLIGDDQGEYQQIRQRFLGKVNLLPNTKMPPRIIHTSIARYGEAIDLQPVQDFAAEQSITFTNITDTLRLLKTVDTTMNAKKLIKNYKLQ